MWHIKENTDIFIGLCSSKKWHQVATTLNSYQGKKVCYTKHVCNNITQDKGVEEPADMLGNEENTNIFIGPT